MGKLQRTIKINSRIQMENPKKQCNDVYLSIHLCESCVIIFICVCFFRTVCVYVTYVPPASVAVPLARARDGGPSAAWRRARGGVVVRPRRARFSFFCSVLLLFSVEPTPNLHAHTNAMVTWPPTRTKRLVCLRL